MKYFPQHSDIAGHVDHYWIVSDVSSLFQNTPRVHAYPGLTPEIIIPLKGSYHTSYLGKIERIDQTKVYAYIEDGVTIDFSGLEAFIIIQFKTRALSSIQPFINRKAEDIMKNSVFDGSELFGDGLEKLTSYLRQLDPDKIADTLDAWMMQLYNGQDGGFIADLMSETNEYSSLHGIMGKTNYSYSTLQRHFKRDTGLSPKKYQSIWRAKKTIEEIYQSKNTDWMHYVSKYEYFDQSHFIKQIKRHTGFSPSQLLMQPALINHRPE